MIIKQGIVYLEKNTHVDTGVFLFERYNLEIIEKTEGNYKENLIRQLDFVSGVNQDGEEIVSGGGGITNWCVYPNETIDSILSDYGAQTVAWTKPLTEI